VIDKTILERYAKYTNSDQGDMARELISLKKSKRALLDALKDAEHLCEWLLNHHNIPQVDHDHMIKSNQFGFSVAIGVAQKEDNV
jgi:hypothetical protein